MALVRLENHKEEAVRRRTGKCLGDVGRYEQIDGVAHFCGGFPLHPGQRG